MSSNPPAPAPRPSRLRPILGRTALPLLATALLSGPMRAQTAPAPEDGNDQIVQMSLFEVRTTQNKGYVVDNSANGFKTSEALMNIPQSIFVVTRDMIDDTATYNPTDTLRYAGVATQFSGAAFNLRGTRVNPLVDGMKGDPSADPVNIDSYQLIKGPAAVFYKDASLGGTVLETTRKPLGTAMGSASGSVNSFGLYRFELDSTGPILALNDVKFNYRVDAAEQDGGMYFTYMTDRRTIIDPSLGLEYKKTSIYFAYNYEYWSHVGGPGNEAAFVNYDGSLFVPSGNLKLAAFLVPNSAEVFELNTVRAGLTQRFSDSWQLLIQAQQHRYIRGPSVVAFTNDVNFQNRTFSVFDRDNDIHNIYDMITADVTGRYNIAILPAQSTFGLFYQDNKAINRLDDQLLPAGWPATNRGPIDNPGPYLASFVLPTVAQFDALSDAAHQYSESESYTTNAYFQETLDVIPKWVSLVGGVAYLTSTAYSIPDTAARPETATSITRTDPPLLHRYGAVVHVTKEIALYGLYSETAQGAQQVSASSQVFPGTVGKGYEAGVKTDLNNGGISITASVYKIQLTNQIVYTGVINQATGAYVYQDIGTTGTKGFEVDAALRVTPEWQVVAHYDHSPVQDFFGNQVAGTDEGVVSLFTRYDLGKNLAFGGGYSRTLREVVNTGGITYFANQATLIDVKEGDEMALFAQWRFDRHWTVRVGMDNVLNAIYPQGINAIVQIDPSPPRSENVRLTYKF